MKDPFCLFGPPELCTWGYAHGTCRFQTTDPKIARKLSSRRNCKLVAWSVGGGYLRVFQENMSLGRAKRLVARYVMQPNERFFDSQSPTAIDKPPDSMDGAVNPQTQSAVFISTKSDRQLALNK